MFFLTKLDITNGSYALWENILPRLAVEYHIPLAVKVSNISEAVLVGDDTDPLVLMIHLDDGNKHNVYFRKEPKKGAAIRRRRVNLIRHKGEEHMPSWRGDTVTYIQAICDLESSWIETCKSE